METDCNSEYDGSPDVSMEEEEEEEDEEEPQEQQLTRSSLKKLNQNDEMKSKLSDTMDTVQSEDSGLTWETSSSRCSTSQASETSATSGVYSMENSFMDCPPGKVMFPMDEEKIVQNRTSNSPDQAPLSPDEKISPDSTKCDFSGKPMEVKAQERELDPADPHSWPFQVQPSKIKDYLVQITQDVTTALPEEKENALMKKGELPLKGTVRARIQLITAVLEERNKKIFQRVNRKDLSPSSDVIKKPREQPKIFSRQGISVSLRHIERDATDKNNKKEILRYNLKHVETNISKSGVSVPYNKDEKRARRSFLPETLNKASEKPPPISSLLADKAKKPDIKSYSPGTQTSIPEQASLAPPDRHDKAEKRETQFLLPSTAKVMPEKSSNLLAETEKQKMQDYSPVTTEVSYGAEKTKALPEKETAQPCSPVSAKPLSYPASKAEDQSNSTITMLSKPTTQEVQYSNNTAAIQHESEQSVLAETRNQDIGFTVPSQLEIKDVALLHSAEETGKQGISLYSPETAGSMPKQAELPSSVSEAEEQEKEQLEMGYSKEVVVQEQLDTCSQAETEQLHLLHSVKATDSGEIETVPDLASTTSKTETQESQSDSYKAAEEHSELPQPSYFTGEAEQKEKEHLESEFAKHAAQAQVSVTAPLEPEHPGVSHSRGKGENQTVPPETQCPDSSLPIADAQREEIHSDSTAVAQSESEHPVIFEPIKAPRGSEPVEPSHLKAKEENQYSPTEALNLSEQLPPISSLLTENVEKQETPLSSLVTATPLPKQPNSVLPCPTEQTKKQENLPYPPETATVAAEASLTTVALQNVKVTEVKIQPLSPTEVPSEELPPISREPNIAIGRKTTRLVSPLSAEPLSEASVLVQEEVKLENQFFPPIDAKLCSEDQDVSHPNINEGQQEGQFHSLGSRWSELDSSVESQSRKQTMEQNSSVSSQSEETTASHSVDQGDKKDRHHPDKPIIEPLEPNSLHPVCVLEKQERAQSEIEQTIQQSSHTVLPMESDMLQLVEETEINGIPSHLPATAQDLSHSIYLTETQENQCVLTGTAALDSGHLTIPSTTAEAEKYNTTETELKHMEKQSIQAATAELEPDYPNVSHSVSESGNRLDVSFPVPSTEEGDLQSQQPMTPELEGECPVSPEREREESGLYSLIVPTSKLESPTAGPETQESPNDSFDTSLNEAPKPSPKMTSFVPDEIKDEEAAKESIVISVLPSEQTNFLSPDLKSKAEVERSQLPFPAETPKMVPEESPSFTTLPIGEAREEPLPPPMAPKIVPQESNSIPEDSVSEEVKEIAPPFSLLPAELLSNETVSLYGAPEGEEQVQPKDMEKQSIQAATAELEPDFPNVSHSVSESGKHVDVFFPVPSTEEGDLQSQQPMTPESGGECPVSSEKEREESGLYSLITPTSELECPTAAPEAQRSPNDSFDTSLNEASKPPPKMISFVPDEIKDEEAAKESIVMLVLTSEQVNFLSPDLKSKVEIERSQLPFPAETPKMMPGESPSFTTFPIRETREEPLYSPMAPKIVPNIPEDSVTEEVKEIAPPSAPLPAEILSHETISLYAAALGEKQDQSHSILNEESKYLAAGKADVQDAQSHLLVTAQSEMRSQDIKVYLPATAQPGLEDFTLLNSTEEIRKQETPPYSSFIVLSAPIYQELLCHKGEQETEERITLEAEHSKEHDAPLKSSIMQQGLGHLKLLQSGEESPIEGVQPYSSTTLQDSPHLAGETGTQEYQGYLPQTAEGCSGVSMFELMDEAKKQELHPPPSEVAQSECKQFVLSAEERGEVQHPLATASLDLEHLGISYSTETQFYSSEAQKQTSKQSPSVSSLLTEKVEEQEVNSHPPAASISSSLLSQSNSALLDLTEEDEKQKNQPNSLAVENVMPEESLSIAAFLISEAKAIHTSFPLTSETENLDAQPPSKEAGLLTERSGSASAFPPETNVTIKREVEPSMTHFESEQFANKPQVDVISRCSLEDGRESISDIPTLPNLNLSEPSNALILEPINDTHTHNLHSSVSSADSNTTVNKAIVISAEDLAKTEEKCLPNVERTLKETENYLQKEKDLKDDEKWREESIPAPELDQGKDTLAISEGYEVANIHAPPLIYPVNKEAKHILESLEYLETVPVLKAKPFNDDGDVVVDHEPSVYKLSGKTSEGLKADNRENKGNESKELVKEKGVQESAETIMENKGDGILNATGIDYVEKYTLIDDASFTQRVKGQTIKDVQRPFDITNENSEEGTSPVASSKNILEFSLLEKDFDKAKKEITIATDEDTSKILNEGEAVRGNYENTEGEFNLVGAGAPLFNPEKDVLSQSPLISLPATTVNPELLEVPPALAFLYKDFYEEAVGEPKEDSSKCPSSEETEYTDMPFLTRGHAPDDGSGIHFEKDIPDDYTPNNLEESQMEKVLKDQPINEQALNQPRVSENTWGPSEKEQEPVHILAEAYAQREVLSPSRVVEGLSDTLIERPTEIMSDTEVGIFLPTYAIPFGSGLYSSGASNDDSSQRREEEPLSEETDQALPEETSDEESSPILDYAATVYQNEVPAQDESQDAVCLALDQSQQSEITEVYEMDTDVIRKPVEESTHSLEAFHLVDTHRQSEGEPEGKLMSALDEPMAQDVHPLDHEHLPCWDTERQTSEERVGENIAHDLTEHNTETIDQLAPEALSDKPFVELDYSLLSHDFDTYPLYSIKEEEYSDIDEDLAELMDYEMVSRDDVFQEETSSEAAREELLFDDRKSLDHVSDSYEFVNEREASMYTEEEEFELMGSEKLPRNVPETEILQKEIEQAQLDTYCYHCKCPISGEDKLLGQHKVHDVTDLDTAMTLLKGQLDGSLEVLQERSLKIEAFVGEIEALFNSLEENCKKKEQLLEEQNESIVQVVLGHHDRKAQSFEEVKNTKMEYLYEKMVNFQEYIDTAKDTLETIIKETEEMDDFAFLQSSEEINKRLLSAVENILTLEKIPAAFSQFEHYAGGSAYSDQTLKHMPVPQTPRLQPQDPSSATSTSIAVYWTVNEDDVIDFFQVYCMEEYPGSKEQSGLVEEYRVTVKESNCILEDLEPGHCYSVWVMAVNYTGCSFPSDKSTFRTAPPIPVIKAEECTVCWDTATIRWSTSRPEATDSFTLEYCRQYSPEGEGLRSLAGIKKPEMKVHLESNVNYFFYVKAVNTFGTSEQSDAALISTKGTRFHIIKETAHPALQVSPNGTMIRLPEDSKLAGISPVLGELLSARGRHYWEATVSGCAAYKVGICYSPVQQDGVLGQNNTSWCLHCPSETSFVYKVLHNGEMSDVIVTEQPVRIGILLDYNTGRLLFFNAERGQVLSAIRHKFTEAAHPAFVLERPGVLNLHTGMELPEFVEQS